MTKIRAKLVPHLWFDREAREAAEFYVSIFPDSRITHITSLHDTPSGSVEIVAFQLFGQSFEAISAGPLFQFNESISFMVKCDSQEELDRYWELLASGGGQAIECGWLKDRYGLSWQIVPTILDEMLQSNEPERLARVTQAFLKMRKFDIAALQMAFDGT